MCALGPGHDSRSGPMTRRSDASNEWVICLFDFTGKDCQIWPNQQHNKLGAINPGESHGPRCTVHQGFIAYSAIVSRLVFPKLQLRTFRMLCIALMLISLTG